MMEEHTAAAKENRRKNQMSKWYKLEHYLTFILKAEVRSEALCVRSFTAEEERAVRPSAPLNAHCESVLSVMKISSELTRYVETERKISEVFTLRADSAFLQGI